MSFLRHGESIDPMSFVPLGASRLAHSQCSSASMSSSRLFLGRLLSSRACLRFAGCERFSKTKTSPYNDFSANGDNPLNSVSRPKGALQSPVLPSLTTVHAGPHTAVRRVELGVNSQALCIVRRQETTRSLPGRASGLHPYLPPVGQTILVFCRVSSLRSHCLLALPFIPLAGYRSGLRSSFPARPIGCSAFRHWRASLSLPTA
jgi:hypothetical protein